MLISEVIFQRKFGIPHQSGRIQELKADIIFEPEYRNHEAFRGLEEYTHIWLIWEFFTGCPQGVVSYSASSKTWGKRQNGRFFATRSPFRPNPIGLSSVRLENVEFSEKYGPVLHVSGADLMDGTPIYDIKPYLAYVDSHPEAAGGFTDQIQDHKLKVEFPEELLKKIPVEKEKRFLLSLQTIQDLGIRRTLKENTECLLDPGIFSLKWMENNCGY